MHLRCLVGLHKRSRSRARTVGGHVTSVCKHCGVAMIKLPSGEWAKAKRADGSERSASEA